LRMRVGRPRRQIRPRAVRCDLVTEPCEQRLQLVAAAVDVADEIERAMLVALVVPQRHALDGRRVDLLGARQLVDVAKPFAAQAPHGTPKLVELLANDVRSEVALGAVPIPIMTEPLRHVEHDRKGETVMLPCDRHQRRPRLGLDVGRIDNGEPAEREAFADDVVEQLEGVARGGLIVLVVADHAAASVGRDDLRRQEMASRERALAGPAGTDEHDERQFRDGEIHGALPS
jgi:hypothetical protein